MGGVMMNASMMTDMYRHDIAWMGMTPMIHEHQMMHEIMLIVTLAIVALCACGGLCLCWFCCRQDEEIKRKKGAMNAQALQDEMQLTAIKIAAQTKPERKSRPHRRSSW